MEGIDLVMRVDTDSQLRGKWADPFEEMEKKGADYMYNVVLHDGHKYTQGLLPVAEDFLKLKNKTVEQLEFPGLWKTIVHDGPTNDFLMFFNNFQLARRSFWQQAQVREWIEFVDRSHGIFLHRWGDSPLTTFTLAMFCPANKIIERNVTTMPYFHYLMDRAVKWP